MARPSRPRAQVLVEVAVVFPLLLLVALGLVQFALYEHAQNVVTAAAEDGARVAAAQGATCKQGQDRAKTLLDTGLGSAIQGVQINVQATPAVACAAADSIAVSVSAKMHTIVPLLLFGPDLPLAAKAEMSKERFRGPTS